MFRMPRERGSASVEAVGSIAALAMFLAVILQLVLVVNAALVAGHATREGARAAALGHPTTGVIALVAAIAGMHPNDADVTVEPNGREPGDLVTVRFATVVARVPVLAAILPELRVVGSAVARSEVSYGT